MTQLATQATTGEVAKYLPYLAAWSTFVFAVALGALHGNNIVRPKGRRVRRGW